MRLQVMSFNIRCDVPPEGSNCWTRRVEQPSGAAFYVYNTHLDHRSQEAREQSTGLLAQRIRARVPVDPAILLGDLNAGEQNPALAALLGAESPVPVDACRRLHP